MNKPLFFLFITLSFSAYSCPAKLTCSECIPYKPHAGEKAVSDTNRKVEVNHKFSIGGSIGVSLPTENYGATDPQYTNYTGNVFYANPGVYFAVNIDYQISKHWGIIFQFEGNFNGLNEAYYTYLDPNYQLGITQTENGTGGGYYLGTYMVGPLFTKSFEKGSVFESWLAGGLMELQQAPVHATQYQSGFYGSGWTTQTIPGIGAVGEGFEVGVKLKFLVSKIIFVTVHVAYDQLYSPSYSLSPLIPIGILNSGIGIEFKP